MVIKMQESGFCFGARGAVEKAMQYESGQKQIVLFGNLVNNENVVQSFRDKGFLVCEDTRQVPENSIVIIRAHGVPRAVYKELKEKNVTIEDCTCIKVKKIHEIVYQKSLNHYKIFIIGKKTHPEVIGTLGWCASGAVVIEHESDLVDLDLTGKICVVAQTTCNKNLWENITRSMLAQNDSIEIYETLCNVMRNREESAKTIAKSSDVMIIAGDHASSNSRELYNVCRSVCENTFFIQSLTDMENNADIKKAIANGENIGFAGSASTPDHIIEDAYHYLLSKKSIGFPEQ